MTRQNDFSDDLSFKDLSIFYIFEDVSRSFSKKIAHIKQLIVKFQSKFNFFKTAFIKKIFMFSENCEQGGTQGWVHDAGAVSRVEFIVHFFGWHTPRAVKPAGQAG